MGSGNSLDSGGEDMVDIAQCPVLKLQSGLLRPVNILQDSFRSLYMPHVGESIHMYLANGYNHQDHKIHVGFHLHARTPDKLTGSTYARTSKVKSAANPIYVG